ncbi:MAG: ATP-binding protein [Spirochaetales bacterium]|nr:ATP-binding protein [Spirochaetales bacterium]
MSSAPRRILADGEGSPLPSAENGSSLFDLVAYYLDRARLVLPFSKELFRAMERTLDEPSRAALHHALLGNASAAESSDAKDDDENPFAESGRSGELSPLVVSAWVDWERGSRDSARSTRPGIDPALIERETLAAFRTSHAGRELCDPFLAHREKLASVFALPEGEIETLTFIWCAGSEPAFRELLDSLKLSDYQRVLSVCSSLPLRELKEMLAPDGKLVKPGFVIQDFFPPPHYVLAEELREFFAGEGSLQTMAKPLETFMADSLVRRAPLGRFSVPAASRRIVEAVLRSGGGAVLVHGAPGTGKTTFVANLLCEAGLKAFVLGSGGADAENKPAFLRLKMAAHVAAASGGVLVVDECESFLAGADLDRPGAAAAKAWLAEFLDARSPATVWIANEVDGVHDAIKRRFVYSLEFRRQDERAREGVWRELLDGYGLAKVVAEESVQALAKKFEVSAGGIDAALRALRSVVDSGNPLAEGEPLAVLSEILGRHETLMTGLRRAPESLRKARDSRYLPGALNVDTSLEELRAGLEHVARSLKERKRAAEGTILPLNPCDGSPEVLEAKLLFSGGPGTGKTAYARWLADALELPLVQKRASDLLSPFVGGTERNIADAFEEAEASGALLLLDEADSLFLDRARAERGWERSQTNELLTRMESFAGILVCCTNRRDDFDAAAMRRFQWKLTFAPPDAGKRLQLYRSYFAELCGEPDSGASERLARLEGLCPGDFAAVHKALVPVVAARGGSARLEHGFVLGRLEAELACRAAPAGRRIGFSA